MISNGKPPFDPTVFLSKVNGGRAISDYRKDQIVYTQGEPADSVFYIQSGKVKKTVVSEQGRDPWSRFWEPAISLGRVLDRTVAATVNRLRDDGMRDRANIKDGVIGRQLVDS